MYGGELTVGINVTSEIKPLKKVLLHRPGKEIENLTPEYLERLLFDDIPFLEVAQKEHDTFADTLRNNGVEVIYLHELITQVIEDENIKLDAINEIVIKNIQSRTVHLDLQVDGIKIEHFSGDGMLISTPMGSTAYNYSAGGSIVDPNLNLLQLTPIAPMNTNAYRSFTSSIILPTTSVISISPEFDFENTILIVADGTQYKFTRIEEVKIYKSHKKVKLLRLNGYEFWNRVSEKFL